MICPRSMSPLSSDDSIQTDVSPSLILRAASNPDSEVAMEALKQISELRRIDADAASDAYLRD